MSQNSAGLGSQTFGFSPLPQGKWIRIMVLEPGSFDDPINCAIQVLELVEYIDPADSYEAISYVWGDPGVTHSIYCQGHRVDITANLFEALRQVRHANHQRRLWTDAICINQRDVEEKGVQVNMMGEVYSKAQRVLVCFGDDGKDGELAKDAISVIRDYNRVAEKYLLESVLSGLWWKPDDGFANVTTARMKDAMELFGHPWFKRVWVLQEVGLAKSVVLAYGSSTIDFVEVILFIVACSLSSSWPGVFFWSAHISSLFTYIWSSYVEDFESAWFRSSHILKAQAQRKRNMEQLEFEDILFRAKRVLEASDARDFVHAFLGHPLARLENGELLIKADYRRSVSELRLCLFSQMSRRSLRFLGLAWHRVPADLAGAPSWCPHLDSQAVWNINWRYDSSLRDSPASVGMFYSRVDGTCLETRALLVDAIQLCGELAGKDPEDYTDADPSFSNGRAVEDQFLEKPSLVERYWSLTQTSESQNGISHYSDKAMAFASTLLRACDEDESSPVAQSFIEFCQDHCPSIYTYLQQSGWLGQWDPDKKGKIPFLNRSSSSIRGDRFFTTEKGFYGFGSPLVLPGDVICIIPTVQPPLIIRPIEGKTLTYQVIGFCYVYGLMYGDAMKQWAQDPTAVQSEMITLV